MTGDIDGLVQDCSNSIANPLKLLQSWIKSNHNTVIKTILTIHITELIKFNKYSMKRKTRIK